jgi:AraC family transcriptional regulator
MPELGSVTIPINTLVLRFKATRAVRINGAKAETATYPRHGIGLMAEGSSGRWVYQDSCDILHIYFANSQLSELAGRHDDGKPVELRDQIDLYDPFLQALCLETARACKDGDNDSLYIDTLSMAIGLRLIRKHAIGNAPPKGKDTRPAGALSAWQLARVRDRMTAAIAGNVSLAELADEVRLSPFHFARAFKKATGLPPHRYIVDLRLDRARDLLQLSDLSVADIAAQVGYDDPSYFARLFRKHFDATPAAYRRERQA